MNFDPWNAKGLATSLLKSDPQLNQIIAAKKALEFYLSKVDIDKTVGLINQVDVDKIQLIKLCVSSCNGDLAQFSEILSQNQSLINKFDDSGLTPLIYSICFNKIEIVKLLVSFDTDLNMNDNLINYTPLMWAVYLNHLPIVDLLVNNNADPFTKNKFNKNAVDLLIPDSDIYVYFQNHNLIKSVDLSIDNDDSKTDYFKTDYYQQENEIDDLSTKIKLQTIGVSLPIESAETVIEPTFEFKPDSNDFDYEKLIPDQFIKFTDSDIPKLLDYIFNLYHTKKHKTTIPATIIYQLLRYAQLKAESKELTDFLFNLFITNIRSTTNTKSGVLNLTDSKNGDIVLISYWLSVLQFLYFYLVKDGKILIINPHFLQEIITTMQSLIAQLSFALNNRMNDLIQDCILNFINLPGLNEVLFRKNWNLKYNLLSRKNEKLSNYDDFFNMLYPPSQKEQMKPSPIRISQTLGALDYVLNLHKINDLIKFQTFSHVFYWFGSTLFNKVIGSKKYLSRSQAIQIRLNLSVVEDWLTSHDFKLEEPSTLGGLSSFIRDQLPLRNLLTVTGLPKSPFSLEFYYGNSFFEICKIQLSPFIELLQWLQCMSSLTEETTLIETINNFDYLNYFQIWKLSKNYKYEINEPKLPKQLLSSIKKIMSDQGENLINPTLNYTTATSLTSKEVYTYFNADYIFPISLPNYQELITCYGSGVGGVNLKNARNYQPTLTIDIMDDIDELKQMNKIDNNETYDYDQENDDEDEQEEGESPERDFKGDEMFKEVRLPTSVVHKAWGDDDIEVNPW